jgi:hypothetical protein
MSLTVYLRLPDPPEESFESMPKIYIRERGSTREISREEWDERFPDSEPVALDPGWADECKVFDANITHNLGAMAKAAGIYHVVWRPEENGITTAHQLIPYLEKGLEDLRSDRTKFEAFNAPNGWGTYDNFVSFISRYLAGCKQYPEALVEASR